MFRKSGKLDKFRLVQNCLLLFSHLVTGILGSDDINNSDQNDQKRFINLSADCASLVPNGTIGVTLHTSEPFFGSLYSRDHPSSCKCVGDGGTSTKLVVTLGQDCGVQTISQRAGKLVAISEKVNSSICYRFLNLKVENYRNTRFFFQKHPDSNPKPSRT